MYYTKSKLIFIIFCKTQPDTHIAVSFFVNTRSPLTQSVPPSVSWCPQRVSQSNVQRLSANILPRVCAQSQATATCVLHASYAKTTNKKKTLPRNCRPTCFACKAHAGETVYYSTKSFWATLAPVVLCIDRRCGGRRDVACPAPQKTN